jgi:hypothetical protein
MKSEYEKRCLELKKLKIGDKVKILMPAVNGESGWENSWNCRMSEAVGQIGTVQSEKDVGAGIAVEVDDLTFNYPRFVLAKEDEEEEDQFREFVEGCNYEVVSEESDLWNSEGEMDAYIGYVGKATMSGRPTATVIFPNGVEWLFSIRDCKATCKAVSAPPHHITKDHVSGKPTKIILDEDGERFKEAQVRASKFNSIGETKWFISNDDEGSGAKPCLDKAKGWSNSCINGWFNTEEEAYAHLNACLIQHGLEPLKMDLTPKDEDDLKKAKEASIKYSDSTDEYYISYKPGGDAYRSQYLQEDLSWTDTTGKSGWMATKRFAQIRLNQLRRKFNLSEGPVDPPESWEEGVMVDGDKLSVNYEAVIQKRKEALEKLGQMGVTMSQEDKTRALIESMYGSEPPYTDEQLSKTNPQPIETETVKDLITTPTLSEGTDVSQMDEAMIINRIRTYKSSIKDLGEIDVKSKHLDARIAKYQAAVDVLVKELDSREV